MVVEEGVTVLNQTPSAFYQLMAAEATATQRNLSLRLVILGGESLDAQTLKPWFERHLDGPRLVNMYGITETTVHVTYRPVTVADTIEATGNRVGRPLADLKAYVLDSHMQLAPVGVPGELYVGGEGVARGYLNLPDLSAERFVPDPFGKTPGARLYRSADLARFLTTGELEYLGRIDRQVKIRGFRIELGEVEAALLSYSPVREAAVLLREDTPGIKQLVAYLVFNQVRASSADEMRSFLRRKLPEHMVPAAFVVLDEMPLTRNGKLDRSALPAPGSERPRLEEAFVAPRNKLEELLAETWKQILRLDRVGIEDDFFALGGDSIRAAVLIDELQARLGEIIHVVAIFSAPTIAKLAAFLAEHYPEAVSKILGRSAAANSVKAAKIDSSMVAQVRRLIKPLAPRTRPRVAKNAPAIFILSAPRSGSTLLRVMLGGHPQLFAPPELELLSFNSLRERKAAFTGRDSFWLEGTLRAIMEVEGCDAWRAASIMEGYEAQCLTTQQFYGLMQKAVGDRRLVDKSPSYALDPATLERAEEDFEGAMYIHLVRHPCGMIQSFDEYRLDQIFFRYEHSFSTRELAELIWLVSNENIIEFLGRIPRMRKHQVKFEDLLSYPEQAVDRLCAFLGLEPHPALLQPYADNRKKMTDGIHAESRMLGDLKFHTHSAIDPRVGDRWKDAITEDSLGEPTRRVADLLGYGRRRRESGNAHKAVSVASPARPQPESPLLTIQASGGKLAFFCVHPVGGGAVQYGHLATHIGPEQPFYGIEGLDPDEPYMEIVERAAHYVKAMREVEPVGPYLLGGWSFGGLVAFEMAQQLNGRGEEVALLALLDPMHPFPGGAYGDTFDSKDPAVIVEQISKLTGWGPGIDPIHLKRLSHEEQLNSIIETGRRTSLLPPGIGTENVIDWLRGFREKLKAASRYVPRVYAGRITLFRLEGTRYADPQEPQKRLDPVSRWSRLSKETIDVHTVPGTHHTMVLEPHVRVLAERLRRCIGEAVDKRVNR
jgi:thioesterase domain-containing protein/acyl carrier protein